MLLFCSVFDYTNYKFSKTLVLALTLETEIKRNNKKAPHHSVFGLFHFYSVPLLLARVFVCSEAHSLHAIIDSFGQHVW